MDLVHLFFSLLFWMIAAFCYVVLVGVKRTWLPALMFFIITSTTMCQSNSTPVDPPRLVTDESGDCMLKPDFADAMERFNHDDLVDASAGAGGMCE